MKKDGMRLIGLCSKSCPEATLMDFVSMKADLATVTIDYAACDLSYPQDFQESLKIPDGTKIEGFKKILDLTEINTLVGSYEALNSVLHLKKNKDIPFLKYFVCFDDLEEETLKLSEELSLEVVNINTLINYGSELTIDVPKPTKDSVFTVNFNSNSTEGMIVTHKMI